MTGIEIAAAAAVAASAVAAAGAIQAGQAQNAMAKYNAQVMENQGIATRQAAEFEEARQRDRTRKVLASQRVAIAKSGLDLEGSPLAVMEDTAANAELDALAIRYSASVEEARAKSAAALQRMQGRQAVTSSYYTAGASLLGGISRGYGLTSAQGYQSPNRLGANAGGFTRNPGGIDAQ